MSMTWVVIEGLDKGGPARHQRGTYDRHPKWKGLCLLERSDRCGLGIVTRLSLSELYREPIFTHQISYPPVFFDDCHSAGPLLRHIMSNVIDLEAQQQVAQVTVAPRATSAFFSRFYHHRRSEW